MSAIRFRLFDIKVADAVLRVCPDACSSIITNILSSGEFQFGNWMIRKRFLTNKHNFEKYGETSHTISREGLGM